MAAIELEKLPKATVDRLARLAHQHGTKLEDEAVKCLERGLSESEQVEADLEDIRNLRESISAKGVWLTDEFLEQAINEGRP